MKYRVTDAAMAEAVSASRKKVLEAIDAFFISKAECMTLESVLKPLHLFEKKELLKLYEQTARGALQSREKDGLLRREGKGKGARYYRVEQQEAEKASDADVAGLYIKYLPVMKEKIAAYLASASPDHWFSVHSLYTAVRPAAALEQPLIARLKKHISLHLHGMQQRGYLASIDTRPKQYYRTGKPIKAKTGGR